MDIDLIALRSLFTVLGLASFIALTVFVYAGKRRHAFDEAARLPFTDDPVDAGTDKQE